MSASWPESGETVTQGGNRLNSAARRLEHSNQKNEAERSSANHYWRMPESIRPLAYEPVLRHRYQRRADPLR